MTTDDKIIEFRKKHGLDVAVRKFDKLFVMYVWKIIPNRNGRYKRIMIMNKNLYIRSIVDAKKIAVKETELLINKLKNNDNK